MFPSRVTFFGVLATLVALVAAVIPPINNNNAEVDAAAAYRDGQFYHPSCVVIYGTGAGAAANLGRDTTTSSGATVSVSVSGSASLPEPLTFTTDWNGQNASCVVLDPFALPPPMPIPPPFPDSSFNSGGVSTTTLTQWLPQPTYTETTTVTALQVCSGEEAAPGSTTVSGPTSTDSSSAADSSLPSGPPSVSVSTTSTSSEGGQVIGGTTPQPITEASTTRTFPPCPTSCDCKGIEDPVSLFHCISDPYCEVCRGDRPPMGKNMRLTIA